MRNRFLDRDYLEGINTEADRPDPGEDRSTGQMLTDYGIKLAEPVVTAARTVTGLARSGENEYLGGQDQGVAADVDRWLGRQQKALREEGQSQFQQNVDQSKWFNRGPDDRSAWDVWPQALASQAAGLVAPGVAAVATGGGSAIGTAIAGGVMGALDSGEAINSTRDFIDQADQRELMKLEPYMKFYRNNGGNDRDARHQLFKESVDLIDVAANVGANVISFGTLGHALSRMGKKVDSNMLKFLGRAAFGVVEGGTAGFLEGAAGETTTQRAAVKQGRQDEIDVSKIVGAGTEAIPGMAVPVGALHAVRRGPADDKALEGTEDYDAHLRARPPGLDTDVSTVLSQTINPTAMDTGPPPGPPHPMFGGEQGPQQAQSHPMLTDAPDLAAEHPIFGPGEAAGPPTPPAPPAPPTSPGMSGPSVAPPGRPGGVWGGAMPGVWGSVPTPPAPPAPTPGPAPGGGVWAGSRTGYIPGGPTETYGPPAPPPAAPVDRAAWLRRQLDQETNPERRAWLERQLGIPTGEQYGPYRPSVPPGPGRGGAPGAGPSRGAPTAPGAPAFPETGGISLKTYEPEEQEAPPEQYGPPRRPMKTIHVSKQDAKKIRAGYRLVPGAGNSYTLETKGGKSVGRVAAHGAGEGMVPIDFEDDGTVMGKGRKPTTAAPAVFDEGVTAGATETDPYAGSFVPRTPAAEARAQPPAETTIGAPPEEHIRTYRGVEQKEAQQLHAAPLKPGRAIWHTNTGDHDVEVIDKVDPRSWRDEEGTTRPGRSWVRYDIPNKTGGRERGEGWISNEDLSQRGGPAAGGGGGGGRAPTPTTEPGGRGTFQEQLRAAAEQIFTPTMEQLDTETENIIRGGVAVASPVQRVMWAKDLMAALSQRKRLTEADFPEEMKERKGGEGKKARPGMDQFEWDTMIHAATRINPLEVIEFIEQAPKGGAGNPAIRELNLRVEGRRARREGRKDATTHAQRGGFAPVVRVEEGRHLIVPWTAPAQETAPTTKGREEFSPVTARENIRTQEKQRQQSQRPAPEQYGPTITETQRQARAYEGLAEKGPSPAAERSSTEIALRGGIENYNERVKNWDNLSDAEQHKLRRLHTSLEARAQRFDGLRVRQGLPLLAETITDLPSRRATPAAEFQRLLRDLEAFEGTPAQLAEQGWAQRAYHRLVDINSGRRTKHKFPIPAEIADAFTAERARRTAPDLHVRAYTRNQRDLERAQQIAAIPIRQRGLPAAEQGAKWTKPKNWDEMGEGEKKRALRRGKRQFVIRKIWALLTSREQKTLMEADAIRLAEDIKAGHPRPVQVEEGAFWTDIFRRYRDNLAPAIKTRLQQAAGVARRLSQEQLRELVIKEVEQLHKNARARAAKGLKPQPLIAKKIEGMRQKALPPHTPTEEEALERMREVQKRMSGQERRTKAGAKQYADRERVINDALKLAIKTQLGTEARYKTLISNIYNLAAVRQPTRRTADRLQTYRFTNWSSLPTEVIALATPAQLKLAENSNELVIRIKDIDEFYVVKKAQLDEARKLRKFLDTALEKIAKAMAAHVEKEKISGTTVKWHLPYARTTEAGVKGQLTETDKSAHKTKKSIAAKPTYHAGSGEEQFGAYSFTADMLNMKAELDWAMLGLDNEVTITTGYNKDGTRITQKLETGEKRTSQRSVARPQLVKRGQKGARSLVLDPSRTGQAATRQEEIARYMTMLNLKAIDFAWMSEQALKGNWEAMNTRRAEVHEEMMRTHSYEAMPMGEGEGEISEGIGTGSLSPEDAARAQMEKELGETEGVGFATNPETGAALTAIPKRDIARGDEETMHETQADQIDEQANEKMQEAYDLLNKGGKLGNMPFSQYVKIIRAHRARQRQREFPVGDAFKRKAAVEPAFKGTAEERAERDKLIAERYGRRAGGRRELTDYRKYGRPAEIDDLIIPAMGDNKGDFFIDPRGRLYEAHTNHPETFEAMDRDAGYNVENEESLYTTGDNPLVRVSTFTWHPEDGEAGDYNHTVNVEAYQGGVTRAQKRTIDRIRREANSAKRDGEHINYIDEVTTGYGGNYYVNMDAVTIRDEPYRGMPLDDDTRDLAGHDQYGYPLDVQRDEQTAEAYSALYDVGTSEHPLISAVETTEQSLDRVKEMLRDGTAGDMPERYINNEFLDQLSRITTGTQVYHAPFAVVSESFVPGRGGARGFYTKHHDRIAVSHDLAPDLYARTVVHEVVHAAADKRLEDDPVFNKEVVDLLAKAQVHAMRQGINLNNLPGYLYGLTDPHEYLTETISNQKFRNFVESVDGGLMQRLYRAIRNTFARVIGFFHGNTALDVLYYDQSTVLGKTDALIARTLKQIEMEGRKRPLPINQAQVNQQADGRYHMRGAGARAFMSDAYGETQQWGKDVAKRAGYAWETRSKDRARGLNWMTQYDWTKVGPQEFRDKSSGAFDTIQKIFAEGNKLRDQDKRELGRAAKIFYGWSKGNRQRAAEGMIDESWHGYWLDRELTDKGNEHFKDDLSAAQAREEHKEGQKEYEYLSKTLTGYREFRSIIHRFSERREEAMRRERINDLVKHGTLIDPDLPPDVRQRVSEAVRDWIDTDPQRLAPPSHPLMGPPSGTDVRYESLKEVLERVPQKDLIKQHLDINDPNVLERVREIRATPENARLPGPYVPFTRQGRFAITGNVDIPTPSNAVRLEGEINHATGEPIGNDLFVFKTEREAREFERMVTHKYHIKQLDGGKLDIDTVTERRAMVPHKMEKGDDPEKFQMARGKALEKLKAEGANIEDRYFVQFQRKHLYYFDNEYEAKQARDALIKEYGAMINLSHPLDVHVRDGRQNEQFVGTELQRQIDHLRQSTAFKRLDQHEQGAVIANLTLGASQYVMKRGVKQRYLPRGFVKGPSTNILGSMDEYSAYTGRYLSKVTHQAELDGRMGEMKNYLKLEEKNKDVLAEQRVYNMMSHRLNSPTENPRDNAFNRWTDRALRWTMLDKLPGIGYFLTNATDPFSVGAPLMMGRHSPMRVAAYMGRMYLLSRKMKALRNGGRDLVEAIRNGVDMTDYADEIERAVKGEVDGARLDALYKFAFDRGFFDRSANLEYQNTYAMNKAAIDKVADWSTGIFQSVNTAIENVNRFVTLGTAYRLEFNRLTKKGDADAHNKAIKYAMDIGHEANGVYANFNTPEYFNKGPIAKLIFQFKKYPQRIMMNYIRAAMGTIRGVGQWAHGEKMSEENKERARQLVAMLITQGLLAGVLGMPTEIFSIPLNIFYQLGLSRYDWDDVQSGFRQWAGKEFGREGGALVSHGVLRWMTGTAIDQRLGQNALLTFGSPGSRKEKDVKVGVLNFLMGATGSSAFQAFTGLQKAGDGMTALFDGAHDVAMKRFGEASRDLIPMRFITDALEASARMNPSGVESFRGQQMVAPLSGGEALVRGLTGLQLRREAEQFAMRRDQTMARENYTTRRKQLSDEFAMSPPGLQRQAVAEKVRRFNEENPDMPPLTVSQLLKAAGTRAKAQKMPASKAGIPDDQYTKALRKRGEVYLTE